MYARKFMDIGAALQWASKTPEEAKEQFKKSCKLCCERYGLHVECAQCPIWYAHETVMKEIFGVEPSEEDEGC